MGPSQLTCQQGGTALQFLAHVYCGQTAVCVRVPLGTDRRSLGDIVLDGNPAPLPEKATRTQILGPYVGCGKTAGWTVTWYGGRHRLRRFCVRWGPSSPPPEKGTAPTQFLAMSTVAKRLDG